MKKFDKLSERQRNILRFMQRYMDKNGFPPTIREIGEATGINSTSVVNYNLNKLVTEGYLERSDRVSRGLRLVGEIPGTRRAVKTAIAAVRVPVVGQIVASAPVPVPEDAYFSDEDMLEVTQDMLRGNDPTQTYALRVKGDSMIDAMVRDGDVIILRRQEIAYDGDMVAIWLKGRGETTLKYFYNEGGGRVRLQPAHPSMQPIYVSAEECMVQGKVLSILRQVG